MRIVHAPENLCEEGMSFETSSIVIKPRVNNGPEYRITQNNDGSLSVRDVTYLTLRITPHSSNDIVIGAGF